VNSFVVIGTGSGLVVGFLLGVFTLGQSWDTPKLKRVKD
jgi:hypothetical protein